MAFGYGSFDKGGSPAIEYLPTTGGESYTVGEMLVVKDGGATKCGAAETPSHLCVGPKDERGLTPATRVSGETVYLATLTADGSALKVGDKVTLSADAMGVTATTASGVAEIVRMDGTEVGELVGVRFAV